MPQTPIAIATATPIPTPIPTAEATLPYGFFIRDFFVFSKEESCGDFGIDSGKVVFAKIESRAHDCSSVMDYSPAPASRDFGDQTMSMEATEDPAHVGAGFFRFLSEKT